MCHFICRRSCLAGRRHCAVCFCCVKHTRERRRSSLGTPATASKFLPAFLSFVKNISQDQNTRSYSPKCYDARSRRTAAIHPDARSTMPMLRRRGLFCLVRNAFKRATSNNISLRRTKRAGRSNSSANSYPWSRCSVSATIPLLRTKREGTARPTH